MLDPKDIFAIGIGTWGLGGFGQRDPEKDIEMEANGVAYAIQKGFNYIETGIWGDEQHTIRIVGAAIKKSGVNRADLFVTLTVDTPNLQSESSLRAFFEQATQILGCDYLDCMQVEMRALGSLGFDHVSDVLAPLLQEGKVRYVSITNNDLATLQLAFDRFREKLFGQEVIFNFEVREYESWGNVEFASINNLRTIIFQPLRRNRTALQNYDLLVELSGKYSKTQNQIIMNWLVNKGLLPITKSSNSSHIDEHLESMNFSIDPKDVERLNAFRHPKWQTPLIDWHELGKGGMPVHQMANRFDELVK